MFNFLSYTAVASGKKKGNKNDKPVTFQALLKAIKNKNNKQVEKILKKNLTFVNQEDSTKQTPLIVAIKHEDSLIVKTLLKYGANPNQEIILPTSNLNSRDSSKEKTTPYQFVINNSQENQKIERIQIIIENHCAENQINLILRNGKSASASASASGGGGGGKESSVSHSEVRTLFSVCHDGLIQQVKTLLEQRIDPNENSKDLGAAGVSPLYDLGAAGVSPLYIASLKGFTEIVHLLLESKADPNKPNGEGTHLEGKVPLEPACVKKNFPIVRLLLDKNGDPNINKNILFMALSSSAGTDRLLLDKALYSSSEIVRLILDKKADPNAVNDQGVSILSMASQCNNANCVQYLLEKKADFNQMSSGFSPLYTASQYDNHIDVVNVLLKYKADPNQVNGDGEGEGLSPLHVASQNNSTDTIKLLLEYKADPYLPNKKYAGLTPLMFSYGHNNVVSFSLLIQQRASIFDILEFFVFLESDNSHLRTDKEVNRISIRRLKLLNNSASKIAVFYRGCKQKQKFKEAQIEAHKIIRRFVLEGKFRLRYKRLRALRVQLEAPTRPQIYRDTLKTIEYAIKNLTSTAEMNAQKYFGQYFLMSLFDVNATERKNNELKEENDKLKEKLRVLEERLRRDPVAQGISSSTQASQALKEKRVLRKKKQAEPSSSSDSDEGGGGAAAAAAEDIEPTLYELENQEEIKDKASEHSLLTNLEERLEAIKIDPRNPSVGDPKKTRFFTEEGQLPVYRVKLKKQYRLFYAIDQTNKKVILLSLCNHDKYESVYKRKGK